MQKLTIRLVPQTTESKKHFQLSSRVFFYSVFPYQCIKKDKTGTQWKRDRIQIYEKYYRTDDERLFGRCARMTGACWEWGRNTRGRQGGWRWGRGAEKAVETQTGEVRTEGNLYLVVHCCQRRGFLRLRTTFLYMRGVVLYWLRAYVILLCFSTKCVLLEKVFIPLNIWRLLEADIFRCQIEEEDFLENLNFDWLLVGVRHGSF